MAVIDAEGMVAGHLCLDEARCFFCTEPVKGVAVVWLGTSGLIVLHAPCCTELILRLAADVLTIERQNDRYVTSRTTDELRRRLIAEEKRT